VGKAWLGRDTEHLPPSNAKVKNEYELYSSPPWHLHGIVGQLYFTDKHLQRDDKIPAFYLHNIQGILKQIFKYNI